MVDLVLQVSETPDKNGKRSNIYKNIIIKIKLSFCFVLEEENRWKKREMQENQFYIFSKEDSNYHLPENL
jgi:hypothetical protein